VFVALGIAVMGALHKKTHKLINIKQPTRYFILFAIISIALIFLSSIYETTSTIFDLIITIQYQQTYTDVALSEYLIPAILQTLTLLIFVLIVIYPLLKEENRQ
jgi:hypothetical protein